MRRATLWLMLGFLGNGFAQFLQKYLHGIGLGAYQGSDLIAMCGAGAVFAFVLMVSFRGRVGRGELLSGVYIGLCSYLGNFAVLRALGYLPAYSAFPLIIGGAILLVALCSWLFFGERLSRTAKLGIFCGIVAVVLLTFG
jgi:multidrug transporter EmrE-like cation transporter